MHVFDRNENFLFAAVFGTDAHGENAVHAAHLACQRKLADQHFVREIHIVRQDALALQNGGENGEIKARAFFFEIGGGEIDAKI